ncbi:MAG: hypothetical protein ACR2LK_05555, partial [Solirubrobacteraceae bacterium]
HYNASLIDYDDLVGIPLPDPGGESLRFVGTPGAVWGAQFVFFDEISRCRPDLQNKLFPIVHERRVAGIRLEHLVHRWAAMNPPTGEEFDARDLAGMYLGSEPLDPALADRFTFVVEVPGWERLTDAERHMVAAGDAQRTDGAALGALVAATCAGLDRSLERELAGYVVALCGELAGAGLAQSPRRARALTRAIAAVHAARLVLDGPDAELEESARLAVAAAIPQTCSPTPPPPATLLAAHRQAWELARLAGDDALRRVLAEPDALERVVLAARLGVSERELSRLVTQALGSQPTQARRVSAATAMFLAFRERHDLTEAAWEPLIELSRRVLEPRDRELAIGAGPTLARWGQISRRLASTESVSRLERAYLLGGFPELWTDTTPAEALVVFRGHLDRFDISA